MLPMRVDLQVFRAELDTGHLLISQCSILTLAHMAIGGALLRTNLTYMPSLLQAVQAPLKELPV